MLTKDGLEVVKYWSNADRILVKFRSKTHFGKILIKYDIECQGILSKTQLWLRAVPTINSITYNLINKKTAGSLDFRLLSEKIEFCGSI